MLAIHSEELLTRLKLGRFEPADVQALEQTSAHELITDLTPLYPYRFQERRFHQKWEVSAASSTRFEIASLTSKHAFFPILVMVPIFRNCVFLSGEGDAVTGISVVTRLVVRPIRKPNQGLALTTGRGFKLDRTPDGWEVKPQTKRTVKLAEAFLQARGWQFELLNQFVPKP